MNLSINPSYYCNFRCDFCYLTEKQLSDKNKITPEKLDSLLNEVIKHDTIDWIDLYGGEIGILSKNYLKEILFVIEKYYDDKINIITNFSTLREEFFKPNIELSVSYDFDSREKSDQVFQNILNCPVPISILILANPKVLKMDVDYMISMLNICKSVQSVEIKPYSINQSNCYNVTHADFEQFVIKWLTSPIEKRFKFINEEKIIDCINKRYNAFSDNHVYITPNGKFAVLEFDLNDREYFLELETWDDYINWTKKEKINLSPICKQCKYYGHCLTEHYRYVKDLKNSCNGYINLLEWYNGRMENTTRNLSST